jgi:hypothetical protein
MSTSLIPGFLHVSRGEWDALVATATTDVASDDNEEPGFLVAPASSSVEDVEELRERVEELEAALAASKQREHARSMTLARAEASRLSRLGWTAFGGLAAALTLYSVVHGSKARLALCSLAAVGSTAIYLTRSRGMVRRMVYGFWVAGVVFVQYKKARSRWATLPDAESEPLWEQLHQACAIYAFENIVELQGFWIKAGQYLSSRADVMPTPYLTELGKLQDSIPARPTAEVIATVRAELGPELAHQLIEGLEETALAAASIAQVHKVWLAPSGALWHSCSRHTRAHAWRKYLCQRDGGVPVGICKPVVALVIHCKIAD